MLGLSPVCMHFMTGSAGPAFCSFVYVQVMEILRTVPEIRFLLGLSPGEGVLVMTQKTEAIFSVRIRRIKIRGIVSDEQPPEIRSMGIMTGRAVIRTHRSVTVLVLLQVRFHVHDHTCFRFQFGIVAFETEDFLLLPEELGLSGSVHFVAVQAERTRS